MPRKKKEEVEEIQTETNEAEVMADDASVEVEATAAAGEDTDANADKKAASSEEISENTASESGEGSSLVGSIFETVSSVVGGVADAVVGGVSSVVSAVTDSSPETDDKAKAQRKRAEKIGIIASDKMTKTVTVRVDRVVKHQVYRKYIKRKKKFMAHDELGSAIGDKVRIVETRPLSAKKRWRVVEIIQKAEK